MDIDQITDDELDAVWGATEEAADMEREKSREAWAKFRKAVAEMTKRGRESAKKYCGAIERFSQRRSNG